MKAFTPHPPLSVLLAEDDDNDAILIERALLKLNLLQQLTTVSDGEKAVTYLQDTALNPQRLPDLIILDHRMPRVSGVDVLFWLRSEPRLRTLPVMVFSVGLVPGEMEMLERLNAAYCVKTVGFQEIVLGMREGVQRAFQLAQNPPRSSAAPMPAPITEAKARPH
jgi:CheY-like chemotaxis protein